MTGDLSEPAHGGRPASLRGRGTAPRAGGRRARPGGGTLPRGRHPFPRGRGAAGGGARLGGAGASPRGRNCGWRNRLDPPPQGAPLGLCRRSPATGDRWHIRQPVTPARFTAVLPRGSSGDTEEPAGTGRGTGTQRKDRCSGGPETSGVVAGNRGVRSGRWRCRSGARLPTACDPSASLPRPVPSRPERAWPFAYPARSSAGPPRTNQQPSCTVYPSRASSLRSSLRDPYGGVAVRSGSSRARASCWLASRAVLHRYVLMSSGVVKPSRMSQV
jgi:hypothetical protein